MAGSARSAPISCSSNCRRLAWSSFSALADEPPIKRLVGDPHLLRRHRDGHPLADELLDSRYLAMICSTVCLAAGMQHLHQP